MKDWVEDLEAHVEEWSERLSKAGRGWWPEFVYHFTDVRNAASILNTGILCSRAEAHSRGVMICDNASPSVIASTDPDHLDFVRMYFRPKTPTQWVNEGIKQKRWQDSGHCPVPIFFLFDFVDLIARDDAHFSRGTMAGGGKSYSQRREYFLQDIVWADVYSSGGIGVRGTERHERLKKARHAEVLIPKALPLGPELRAIYCRSEAERTTLLFMLDDEARQKWESRIRTGRGALFNRHRPYVQSVAPVSPTQIRVELFQPTPATLSVEFAFRPWGEEGEATFEGEFPARSGARTYNLPREFTGGVLDYRLEGCWGYHGDVLLADLPF